MLLKEYGMSYDDLKAWGGSIQQVDSPVAFQLMKDGGADLFIFISGTRQPNVVELSQTSDAKYKSLDEIKAKKLKIRFVTYNKGSAGDVMAQ